MVEADVVISEVIGRAIERCLVILVRAKPPPVSQSASPQAAGAVEAALAVEQLNGVRSEEAKEVVALG